MTHCFHVSSELKKRLEACRPAGRWSHVQDIVSENDKIMKNGGFSVAEGERQALHPVSPTEIVHCEPYDGTTKIARFDCTEICVANVDTLTAAFVLGDACALNFANASTPGGRYRSGARAQEEDLCRLLPQLYPALQSSTYPIMPDTALVTRQLLAVRRPGTYDLCRSMGECTIISSAMPCGMCDKRPKGGWAGSPWAETVTLRIRAVLQAARRTGQPNLVLGAFGCGAFGNPAGPVADIFREQLCSPEFRGAFACVVFAIIDPVGTGNLAPFQKSLASINQGRVNIDTTAPLEVDDQTIEDTMDDESVGSFPIAANLF